MNARKIKVKNEKEVSAEEWNEKDDWMSELPKQDAISSWWMKKEQSAPSGEGGDAPLPKASPLTVTIVGTGMTGTSCLLHLVNAFLSNTHPHLQHDLGKSPIHLVLIEARSFCSGATGRNGGHLCATAALQLKTKSIKYDQDEAIREMKLEQRSIVNLIDMIAEQGWCDSVDLAQGGNVHLFDNLKEQSAQLEELEFAKSLGIDLSDFVWLDQSSAVKEYGLKPSLTGALKIPGSNLFPLKLVTNMYNLAKSKASSIDGLEISLFTHTPVLKVTRSDKTASSWVIHTSRGDFESKYVIHATNAYTSYLLPQFNASSSEPIVPTRAQVVAIQPRTSDGTQVWTNGFSAHEGFDYLFQRPLRPNETGSTFLNPVVILGGGRNRVPPHFEFGISDDSKLNDHVGGYLRNFLPTWFPHFYSVIDSIDVVHEWPGIMGFTRDHDPIVGQVFANGIELDGQYISAGYSGHGMSRAPGCAEVVVSMILADMMKEKWVAPDWFPIHYLTSHDRKGSQTKFKTGDGRLDGIDELKKFVG